MILEVLRSVFSILFVVLATNSAHANCFDTPSWYGDAIDQEYIDSIPNNDTNALRRAHLRTLLLSEKSISVRREILDKRALPIALQLTKGDRGALRKRLKDAKPIELFRAINVDELASMNSSVKGQAWASLIDYYWLNGCAIEAIKLLDQHHIDPNQEFFRLAIGQVPQLPRDVNIGYEYEAQFFKVIKSVVEQSEGAAELLTEFKTLLDENRSAQAIGVGVALDFVRGQRPSFVPPTLPDNPSETDLLTFYLEWASIANWTNLTGKCQMSKELSESLLKTSHEDFPNGYFGFRSFLEASYMFCETSLS